MRICFTLATANIIVFCLLFTSGCQNESEVTNRSKPARAVYKTQPMASGESTENIFSATESPRESEASMLESRVSFESEDPGKFDINQSNNRLTEAWSE